MAIVDALPSVALRAVGAVLGHASINRSGIVSSIEGGEMDDVKRRHIYAH
jgi:hypothetical protein